MSKIVLIGANHAGTAMANTLMDTYPGHELVIIDRNNNISYLGCGTALWVGGQITGTDGLFYCSREIFEDKGATVHMETEVDSIDFENKVVHATKSDGTTLEESYDKLVLATGSLPIDPKIPGMDLENVRYVKLFQDGQAINAALDSDEIKRVAVIGAGYIGVEVAEAVERRGKKALLFDTASSCLSGYYDDWFTNDMNANLEKNGVELHYNETLTAINGEDKVSSITTDKGEYEVDLVLMAIGFKPNTGLGADHLTLFRNGAFLVDLQQKTNDPDVYAIGDCATVFNNALQDTDYIALATNAVRSGVVAAHNLGGTPLQSEGVQGSNGIKIYDYMMVSTGLSLENAKKAGFDAVATDFEDTQKPAFMTDHNEDVKIRIVYDKESRRVLGAQMASYQDMSMGIHMFSLAIDKAVTIEEISLLDIFFMPHFNQPYNYITMAALSAEE